MQKYDPDLLVLKLSVLLLLMVALNSRNEITNNYTKKVTHTACSRAIHDREVAHKRYFSLPSYESHAFYILVWNYAKSAL